MKREHIVTAVLSALVIATVLLAGFAAAERHWFLWGVSFYSLYPTSILISAAVIILSLLIPSVQNRIFNSLTAVVGSFDKLSTKNKGILGAASAVVFIIFLWSFKQSLHFLGDGYLLLRNLPLISSPVEVFGFYQNSPLSGMIYYFSSLLIRILTQEQFALFTYQSVSIVCGFISFVLLMTIAKVLFPEPLRRMMFVAGIMAAAVSQMFFGYVENYSVSIVFLLVFVLTALQYLSGRRNLLFVTIAFASLLLSHYGMIYAAPAYLFLLYSESQSKKIRSVLLNCLLLTAIGGLIYFGVYARYPQLDQQMFGEKIRFLFQTLPEMADHSYAFLSMRHLTDVGNLILLIFPVGLFFLPFIIVHLGVRKLLQEKNAVFFFLLAAGMFLFVLVMKGELGMSRDWDLYSVYLYPSVIFFMVLLLRAFPIDRFGRYFVVITGTVIVHSLLWISTNSSETRSLHYFESLPNEKLWSAKALSNTMDELGSFYQSRKEYRKSLEYNLKYQQYHPSNVRMMENIGSTYYYIFSDDARAELWYTKAIAAESKDWQVYNNLGEIYLKRKEIEPALSLFTESKRMNPSSIQPKLNIAFILGEVRGKKVEALNVYLQVLQLEPDNANGLLNAGYLSYQLKQYEQAKRTLTRWIQLFPRDPNAENIRNLLASIL